MGGAGASDDDHVRHFHLYEGGSQIDAYGQGRRANPVFDEELMGKCSELGKRVAEAVGKPYEEVEWYGEEGVCPVCHGKVMMMDQAPRYTVLPAG